MDFKQLTQNWTKGEIGQAKMMIILGCAYAVIAFLLWASPVVLYNGIVIPLVIITVIFLFFGAFAFKTRVAKLEEVLTNYKKNTKQTIENEHKRVLKEKQNYKRILITWVLVWAVGAGVNGFSSTDYQKGVGIGIMIIGLSLFLIDFLLLIKINKYYTELEKLKKHSAV